MYEVVTEGGKREGLGSEEKDYAVLYETTKVDISCKLKNLN